MRVVGLEYKTYCQANLNFVCQPGIQLHLRLCGSGDYAINGDPVIRGRQSEFQFFSSQKPWNKFVVQPADTHNKTIALAAPYDVLRYYIGAAGSEKLTAKSLNVEHFRAPLESQLNAAVDELLSVDAGAGMTELVRDARILDILVECFRYLLSVDDRGPPKDRIRLRDEAKIEKAAEHLVRNLVDPPCIPDLARLVGLNSSKLKYAFKTLKGVTIGEFVRTARLDRAAEHLRNDEDVEAAAFLVGYRHAGNFARLFRAKYGVPPSVYRNRGQPRS